MDSEKSKILSEIEKRKLQQLSICLNKDVQYSKPTGFEHIELQYNALPEVDYDAIDASTKFLGRRFKMPLFITGMTGGCRLARKINENLAIAAETMGIGMGVGSQRAALEYPELADTYSVRHVAQNVFVFSNLGAAQILQYDMGQIRKAVDMIKADGLAIHLNAVQEAVQPEGDKMWNGVERKIAAIKKELKIPILVKEVGCGISGKVAARLEKAGVDAIDVSGAGGTSWAKAEFYRGAKYAEAYVDFGIPTANALEECAKATKLPLIAAGGVRNGLQVAKAIAMGATLGGFALPVLKPATESPQAVIQTLERFTEELKIAMFLVGAQNLSQLKGKFKRA
ncbi:MAG: type 2 isopentenyl-diphosphate Delta-isomerase [Candidatus Aenigmarchaeota archaeon]|nr:type 2 isopentenyl-diphosphate Delta-isomerase [Candidatus Aenigmarchaeota archaeon]